MLSRINKLKIAPRLILCFAVIVLLMLVGNSLLVWQFGLVRQQSDRVSALARELVVVSRFQTDILSLDAKLDSLAKSEDIDGLKREAGRLRSVLLTDTDAVRDALIRLPSDLPRDTAILPTVEAVEITLPPQLDAVLALGAASDWNVARLRLATEKKPLEASASNLVRSVEQQVSDQLSRSVVQAERVQRRILLVLPLTAFVTLLVSTFLAIVITQSISAPLRQLVQGSTALALGDFDHQVQLSGNDELARLGAVFNETTAKLRELYRQIRGQEAELRQMLDLTPLYLSVLGHDGSPLYANRASLDYLGLSLDEWRQKSIGTYVHPDDVERLNRASSSGSAYELELRVRNADGKFRWILSRFNPLYDEKGQITRWYLASTDIDDRKRAEEKLRQENIALREEIGRGPMFEEIVGTSQALKAVLSQIDKVAPTDSTVLITGETGTGKELIARAVHKRSARSGRAFISVNCAAFAPTLISSELFGHEKGAFTGALQRRLGRFELADGGTIFLDEVGELPPETQIVLLRVLQEREFERVGGTQSIKVDVRIITATNRDLNAAVSNGSFRSDLFYRLQVFPIETPPLRERRKDIPLLVEYFIDRYARKAGKNIRRVRQETLELLQSYAWPGNIRELQNVVERSVILCETETFSIDESWLPRQPQLFLTAEPKNQVELPRRLEEQEKDMIEEALKASRGRVFGPTGAAAKLGIPRSTLESKIKSLKIDKNRFRILLET
jgi:formate hydrogenlyase transcriptional activator